MCMEMMERGVGEWESRGVGEWGSGNKATNNIAAEKTLFEITVPQRVQLFYYLSHRSQRLSTLMPKGGVAMEMGE